ncbi:NUDIX domain-containing protein [Mucilaginibacter koreensis]
MPRYSAGILLYRIISSQIEVFLVHPGGPYFKDKDAGAWTVPKGEYPPEEEPLAAAQREFAEETGTVITGQFRPLTPIKQKGGKVVSAWAVEGNIDADTVVSNTFKMEYPYKSGRWISVPEVDRAAWFDLANAREKVNPAQVNFLDELEKILN